MEKGTLIEMLCMFLFIYIYVYINFNIIYALASCEKETLGTPLVWSVLNPAEWLQPRWAGEGKNVD